jgi:hypothetical protein
MQSPATRPLLSLRALLLVACSSSSAAIGTHDERLTAEAARDAAPPLEFHDVHDGLYRGAHPDRAGLEYVRSRGVTTILSLQIPDGSMIEGDKAAEVAEEQDAAKELGLRYVIRPDDLMVEQGHLRGRVG